MCEFCIPMQLGSVGGRLPCPSSVVFVKGKIMHKQTQSLHYAQILPSYISHIGIDMHFKTSVSAEPTIPATWKRSPSPRQYPKDK